MKEIQLTQNQVTLVDDIDFKRLNQHKWYAHWCRDVKGYYAVRSSKPDDQGKQHFISMARKIMKAQAGQQIDHANHQTLDNRKQNLRVCTRVENSRNRIPAKNCSSAYKGVDLHKATGKWRARIQYEDQAIYLGLFDNEEEAGLRYDGEAIRLFGEFALPNFGRLASEVM